MVQNGRQTKTLNIFEKIQRAMNLINFDWKFLDLPKFLLQQPSNL